jgi:hypothetical protein
MDSKAQSDITRDADLNLTQTELIRTKSTFKREGNKSTVLSTSPYKLKNSNFGRKARVRFDTNKNEIIYIESFKAYNAENVFTEPRKKSIHCKCIIY